MLSGRVYQLSCILLVKLLISLPSTRDTEVDSRSRDQTIDLTIHHHICAD